MANNTDARVLFFLVISSNRDMKDPYWAKLAKDQSELSKEEREAARIEAELRKLEAVRWMEGMCAPAPRLLIAALLFQDLAELSDEDLTSSSEEEDSSDSSSS